MIGAKRSYVFSGQFSLRHDFAYPTKELLRLHEMDYEYSKWYDIMSQIKDNMIYFYPARSGCDIVQSSLLKDFIDNNPQSSCSSPVIFPMKSNVHGVPVYTPCLETLLRMDLGDLRKLRESFGNTNEISPLLLSMKLVGFGKTLLGILMQEMKRYKSYFLLLCKKKSR